MVIKDRESGKGRALINASGTMVFQMLTLVFSLVCRTIFSYVLGQEVLGLNGVFANVICILSFVDLGIESALIYKLYKPICDNDIDTIRILVGFYKYIYRWIIAIVFVTGIMIFPLLRYIVTDSETKLNLNILYVLVLLDTMFSYIYAYKKTVLIADQKNYIIEKYTFLFTMIINLTQMLVLVLLRNYYFYLLSRILLNVICCWVIGKKAEQIYPYIKKVPITKRISKEELKELFSAAKGLALEKAAAVSFGGTDNFFISKFEGLSMVGIVSQYTLILTSINGVLNKIFGTLISAIGKFNIESGKKSVEQRFRSIYFFNAMLYGILFVGMLTLLDTFVTDIWMGNDYRISFVVVFLLIFELSIRGIHYPVYMIRSAFGLFSQFRLILGGIAILNVILDYFMGKIWGTAGIVMATIFCRMIDYMIDIFVIYRYGFGCKPNEFIKLLIKVYFYISLISLGGLAVRQCVFFENIWIRCIVIGVIVVGLYSMCGVIVFWKNEEFQYLKKIISNKDVEDTD